ncbi:MAG: hydroxyisourate hydrolase [Gemmatimonadaceae bacterium]
MIKLVLAALAFAIATPLLPAPEFQLSTHVLDTTSGTPGVGVAVLLERKSDAGTWKQVSKAITGANGRFGDFLPLDGTKSNRGTYRLTFDLEKYFKAKGVTTVFPEAVVVFKITDETHYHIPVVVTPFAISTYRGS